LSLWEKLRYWMEQQGHTEFSEEVGNQYLETMYGTHLLPVKSPVQIREGFRAVRMLISYQKSGEFEFRSPSIEYTFEGNIGVLALDYLDFCRSELGNAQKTLENKRLYLHDFSKYMDDEGLTFADLSVDAIEAFFGFKKYSLASRHNCANMIRHFLQHVYDAGKSDKDCSVYVLKDNYRKNSKLPTTYEEQEIRDMIGSVERASSIGKRDYLVLLLATEYGWRAKDITKFSFDQIDWDKNVIRFEQHKTDVPVEFPLLSSVGNAIIDYLKHGRPVTDAQEVIVSHLGSNRGESLSSPTIHSIVTKYLRRAGVKNWSKKKHGPHAMRHSLATNLLKKNVALPIISTVMGHQRTETTNVYISVDYDKLKACALPMPPLCSSLYSEEVSYGKI
ncbi:MAG: tyrosine-type recombinase/integrase, partial [Lachnospiraceae bacterium]|nr:tyrosine-type recombinase/integrase [Lachnospiraceae bacterium]